MRVLHWFPNYRRGGGVANAVGAMADAQSRAGADVAIACVADGSAPMYGVQNRDPRLTILDWTPTSRACVAGMEVRRPGRGARSGYRPQAGRSFDVTGPPARWLRTH